MLSDRKWPFIFQSDNAFSALIPGVVDRRYTAAHRRNQYFAVFVMGHKPVQFQNGRSLGNVELVSIMIAPNIVIFPIGCPGKGGNDVYLQNAAGRKG